MDIRKARKDNRGFTIFEFLVIMAVLVLLAAVTFPGIWTYSKRVRIAELDDAARSVFMAAQSRLTALKLAGEAGKLKLGEETNKVDPNTLGDPEGGIPVGNFYYLPEYNAMYLLPEGTIEEQIKNGYYVIEFDPDSGVVYSVFYSDEPFDYVSNPPSREEASKRAMFDNSIGYYGGSTANVDRPELGQLPIPRIEIINAEELVVKIQADIPADLLMSANLTVTIVGVTSGASKEVFSGYNNLLGDIVLDTLDTNSRPNAHAFSTDYFTGFIPGEDITVKVSISDTSGRLISQTAYATVNSLFASVDAGTAKIAYGRHLQNLNKAEGITSAKQIKRIDFAVLGERYYSWGTAYPDRNFEPIIKSINYDGASLGIYNMKISADMAGMFGYAERVELKNIVLSSCEVMGVGSAGVLAANLDDCYVENIVVSDSKVDSKVLCGAVAGAVSGGSMADVKISGCEVLGDGNGGAVGRVTHCEVSGVEIDGLMVNDIDVGSFAAIAPEDSGITDSHLRER